MTSTPMTEQAGGTGNGYAIASLVSGIAGLLCVAPLVGPVLAVVFGHMSRHASRQPGGDRSGDGMALAGLICGYLGLAIHLLFVALAVLSMFAGMMLPVLSKAREKAQRVNDAGNLKQLGLGLLMYSGDHDGDFPDDLGQLVDQQYMSLGKVWTCPNTSTPPPTTSAQIVSGTHCDYEYVGKGLNDADPQPTSAILMYTRPGSFARWINVLFVDGHVEGFPAGSLETILQQNPQFRVGPPEPGADAPPPME